MVKRSGATEPFSREKVVNGVRKACQGRPVSEDDLALLAQRVEETLRSSGQAEVDAYEIGLAILGPLRELDEVAYLRFASVYQGFDSLEDFEAAITVLRAAHEDHDDADVAPLDGAGRGPEAETADVTVDEDALGGAPAAGRSPVAADGRQTADEAAVPDPRGHGGVPANP